MKASSSFESMLYFLWNGLNLKKSWSYIYSVLKIQVASPNKKLDPKGTGNTPSGEGVLANFFNSLLYKKSGSSPGPPGSPGNVSTSPNKVGKLILIFLYIYKKSTISTFETFYLFINCLI